MIKDRIKTETKDLTSIFNRIKKRDFSGNSGMAIKNSIFQFSTSVVAKIGSLIFTVILARLLMPDLFGLYSLALSTILLFATFSDLGIGQSVVKFMSKSISKKKKIASNYFSYLFKIKGLFLVASSVLLIISAYFISHYYYDKPIFLALIAGSLYLILLGFTSLFDYLFQAANLFKKSFFKEIIFQISRLILIPTAVILFSSFASPSLTTFAIIFSLSICYLITFLIMLYFSKKSLSFVIDFKRDLNKEKKKKVNYFLKGASFVVFSGMFLGYIDVVMLGKFVSSETIGFYQAALSIVGALIYLIPFSISFFPLFNILRKEELDRYFKKSIKITLLLSLAMFFIVFFFSEFFVKIIFGLEYAGSAGILRVISFLILFLPLSNVYVSFFLSVNKSNFVAKALIYTTLLNVVLNYAAIKLLLTSSELLAASGVAAATVLSRIILLVIFYVKRAK